MVCFAESEYKCINFCGSKKGKRFVVDRATSKKTTFCVMQTVVQKHSLFRWLAQGSSIRILSFAGKHAETFQGFLRKHNENQDVQFHVKKVKGTDFTEKIPKFFFCHPKVATHFYLFFLCS